MADSQGTRVYWGSETAKALENFGRGGCPRALIAAYSKVKLAALSAVQEVQRRWSPELFGCIEAALRDIEAGRLDAAFPLPLMQGGAGTSLNMNLNEVASARALELWQDLSGRRNAFFSENSGTSSENGVPSSGNEGPSSSSGAATSNFKFDSTHPGALDPFEDLNRSQSTNDTFPTAVTIVAFEAALKADEAAARLQEALADRERAFEMLLVAGRTELQDALPLRFGQIFGAWAGALERDRWRFSKVRERLRTVALGGTAVGTCFNASPAYLFAAEKALRRITGLPLSRSQNLPDEESNADKYAELASAAALCAGNLRKISSDLLLYGSSAFGELRHPELQYGSTIMPAKANPVMLELAKGLAIAAQHEAAAVQAYAFEGQLQLNAFLPFLAQSLIDCFQHLEKSLDALRGILPRLEVQPERISKNLRSSKVLLNLLVPRLGYLKVKELFRDIDVEAVADEAGYLDLVAEKSGLSRAELALIFSAENATAASVERKTV